MIKAGKSLSLAGSEELLSQLPPGNWVGGTTPYFMGDEGGEFSPLKIFANDLGVSVKSELAVYDAKGIERVYIDAPENGFSLIVLPASSEVHAQFARRAPNFTEFAAQPLIGWVAGAGLGSVRATVFNGAEVQASESHAVVLHVRLPSDKAAAIKIVNIYEQGHGPLIEFEEMSFEPSEAFIDGERRNLAEFLISEKVDPRLPLVADYFGAMTNTAVQSVDRTSGLTRFHAPVFPNVEYRVASPVGDFAAALQKQMPADTTGCAFLCNSILNYMYGQLDGKKTGEGRGPLASGEVAYQLLNQTMTYLVVDDV